MSGVFSGALRVDGLVLRRTREGRLALSYPARDDAHGNRHFVVAPVNDETRRSLLEDMRKRRLGRLQRLALGYTSGEGIELTPEEDAELKALGY